MYGDQWDPVQIKQAVQRQQRTAAITIDVKELNNINDIDKELDNIKEF